MKDNPKTCLKLLIATQYRRYFWIGLLLAAIGVICFLFPAVATGALNNIVGTVVAVAGVVQLYQCVAQRAMASFGGALISGLVTLLAGLTLLFIPFTGAVFITMTLVIMVAVAGVYELSTGLNLRPARGWGWMVGSGVVSIALAVMIVTGLPSSAWILPGIVMGVHFLTTGLAMAVLAHALKSEHND